MSYRKKELDDVNGIIIQAFIVSQRAVTHFAGDDPSASLPLFDELSKLEAMVKRMTDLVGAEADAFEGTPGLRKTW